MANHYTFAPGVVLDCDSRGRLQLCRLTSDGQLAVPAQHATTIEYVALGVPLPQSDEDSERNTYLRELRDAAWIVCDAPLICPIIEPGLRRLDQRFSWTGALNLPGYDIAVQVHSARRRLRRSLGQYPALPETVARRSALLGSEKLKVLVLGDDDLLSLVLARNGHQVVSVDADLYLTKYIKNSAVQAGFELDCRRWDFRQPVPDDLVGQFDVVFTDPMSSASCLPLFIDRALACVCTGGRIFVCVSQAAAAIFDQHRRETRVEVSAHHSDFNHYYTTYLTLSPYMSDLYELKRGTPAKPTLAAEETFYGSGIFDEEHYGLRPASRFVIRDIRLDFTDLLHLKTLVTEALNVLDMELVDEAMEWSETTRTYVALLPGGRVVCIAVHAQTRMCELFTSPREEDIERVFEVALMGLFGGKDIAHSISRSRGTFSTTLPG